MNKKGQISIIIISVLVAIFILLFFFKGVHLETTRDGSHTGYVTAVETNGLIFKTITVYVKTDAESSQEDIYCLIDKSLINTLKELENNKTKVTIQFIDYLFPAITECGSYNAGIITGVKE